MILNFLKRIFGAVERSIIHLKRKFRFGPVITSKDWAYKKYEIGEFTYGTPEILTYHSDSNLKIGKFCSIANGVKIFLGGNHKMNCATTFPLGEVLEGKIEKSQSKGNVTIGNDVWIGYDAMILSGVKIGNGAIIGARAIISKNVDDYAIIVGNPGKQIKKRFDEDQIKRLLEIQWWNWPLNKIKQNKKYLHGDINKFIKRFKKIN